MASMPTLFPLNGAASEPRTERKCFHRVRGIGMRPILQPSGLTESPPAMHRANSPQISPRPSPSPPPAPSRQPPAPHHPSRQQGSRTASAPSAWTEHADGAVHCHAEGGDSMHPSLTLRGERTAPDGTLNATEPTERSEIASCQAARTERRDLRQRGGCSALVMAAGHRPTKTTPDTPPIPDLLAQPRGVEDGESGVGCGTLHLLIIQSSK